MFLFLKFEKLSEREGETERETEGEGAKNPFIVRPLFVPTHSYRCLGMARPSPRAGSFIQVSHMGTGIQTLESFPTTFPRPLART